MESELFISELSLAEIERGVNMLLSKDVTRARRLAQWLAQLGLRFAERSLSLDRATLRIWASSSAQADLAGQRMPSMDALLMATAQKHGLTIVTRNTCDFARYDKLLDPWQVA